MGSAGVQVASMDASARVLEYLGAIQSHWCFGLDLPLAGMWVAPKDAAAIEIQIPSSDRLVPICIFLRCGFSEEAIMIGCALEYGAAVDAASC